MASDRIEVMQAGPERLPELASMFGRAFVAEPMMRWPLGEGGDLADRFTRCFSCVLEEALPRGMVWQTDDAKGAAIWDPPGGSVVGDEHPWYQPRINALADDGGRRYEAFWDWVYSRTPEEPLWQLDSIAVEPAEQGRGLGAALIEAGLARARTEGMGAFLSTGTPRNVPFYRRAGFHLVEDLDAPEGGPHVWFMRSEP